MAERSERVTTVSEPGVAPTQTTAVRGVSDSRVGGALILARLISYLTSLLLLLLAFRFVFVLLGANPSNGFANFIYKTSHPFVAPFFNLFSYHTLYGVHRFEGFALVAMVVYAIVGYGLAQLVTIHKPEPRA